MIDQIKQILLAKYDADIEMYNILKSQVMDMENMIAADNSEENYNNNLKELKKMKLKKNSEEYKEKLKEIEISYEQALIEFKKTYDKYNDLKKQMTRIDVYRIQRNQLRVENARELKDLRLDEETAYKIISGEMTDII